MDLTLRDVGGSCLVVSQFTLAGALQKGNRPSFTRAEQPEPAERLYLLVAEELRAAGVPCTTGRFGADMAVDLVNDGPVTFVLYARGGRISGPTE
jgi:D-tyrosyl-tRNA(Tyr) deacylase